MGQDGILIETVGVFRVTTADGVDVTPVGIRPRAVLAAIALHKRRTAPRRWLENLIWGDRGQEQASGSLRQALSSIRRSLGELSDLLHANRVEVSLAFDGVQIDVLDQREEALKSAKRGHVLLEGLDIRSEPFEEWLRLERSHLQSQLEDEKPKRPAAQTKSPELLLPVQPAIEQLHVPKIPQLYAETDSAGGALAAFFADAVSAQLGQTAQQHIRTDVIMLDGDRADVVLAPGTRCIVRVVDAHGRIRVLVRLTEIPSGKLMWSRQLAFDSDDETGALDAVAAMAFEASEAIAFGMAQAGESAYANSLAAAALKDVFSFDPERIEAADALLEQAHEIESHAPRPALRALARAFLSIERSNDDAADVRDAVRDYVNDALQTDPGNPLALAFIADVYDLVFDDPVSALSNAERALAINPGTGYAHASLGGLELRRSRPNEALVASRRARNQLENTSLQVFSLMRYCVAAMSTGAFGDAADAAQKASVLAPESRPPLRHLYALRLQLGDTDGAREVLTTLRRLEPDFSLAKVRADPEFPAATLRKTKLSELQDVEP